MEIKAKFGRVKAAFCFAFLIFSTFSISLCQADIVPNQCTSYDPNVPMAASAESGQSPDFDPNAYNFLIYDSYGEEASIQQAMQILGITCDLIDH